MEELLSIGVVVSLGLNLWLLRRTRNMVRSERNGIQVILKDRKGKIKSDIIRDESND